MRKRRKIFAMHYSEKVITTFWGISIILLSTSSKPFLNGQVAYLLAQHELCPEPSCYKRPGVFFVRKCIILDSYGVAQLRLFLLGSPNLTLLHASCINSSFPLSFILTYATRKGLKPVCVALENYLNFES